MLHPQNCPLLDSGVAELEPVSGNQEPCLSKITALNAAAKSDYRREVKGRRDML